MTNDTNESGNVYSSNDVAAILKIQDSTLRKYAIMLEEQGYKFHKNSQGHRGYFNNDVIALKKLIEIKKHPDMTLKQACVAVISWVKEQDKSETATDNITTPQRYNERLFEQFEEFKLQQVQFNKELLDELKKRDQTLLAAIRESQQEKLMIAATQETEQDLQKKKPWFLFFRK